MVQPAIVISRWTGKAQDGHGHHLAIGMVIQEAFDAAGNPGQFQDLCLPAWQPRKLYCSTSGDWEPGVNIPIGKIIPNYERDGYVRVNTGVFDPLAGRTYQEQAWIGFNSHKTQAMGFTPEPGDFYYYYILRKSLVPQHGREQDLFDGMDPKLTGLAGYPGGLPVLLEPLERITALASQTVEQYRMEHRLEAGRSLLAGLGCIRSLQMQLPEIPTTDDAGALQRYLARIEVDFELAAAHCLGLRLECLSNDARVCPGQRFKVRAQLWNQEGIEIGNPVFSLHTPAGWKNSPDARSEAQAEVTASRQLFQVTAPENAALGTPYWLRKPHGPYKYEWEGTPVDGLPFGPRDLELSCQILVDGQYITLREPAVLRETFAGGFRELPVAVIPPISIHPHERQAFLPVSSGSHQLELSVILRSNTESTGVNGQLTLEAPPDWQVSPDHVDVSLGKAGDAKTLILTVTIPANANAGQYLLRYVVQTGGREYDVILEPVRMVAPGLPGFPEETNCIQEEFITVPAGVMVDLIDVDFVPGLKYGFIKGSDEQIVESLAHFPIEFHLMNDEELGYVDLHQFDAVIVGPDAYLVRDELRKNANRFLEYIAQGGTLIVLRQGYTYQRSEYTPYPIRFHEPNDEVTFEDAPVSRLQPEHPLLNLPNAIGDTDFANWVFNRGNFFIGEWDTHYESLLACSDPGEDPKSGGLLIASYGQGTYLYCAYSLWNQLTVGVPGAFRLLANLLAVPQERVLEYAQWLKRAPFFSKMSKDDLLKVAKIATDGLESYGIYLCHEGELADKIYLIIRGQVEIIKESQAGQIIAVAGPDEMIGELGVLAGLPRHVAMRTRGEVHLLSIAGADLIALMHEHHDLMERIIQVMASELVALRSY